MKNEILVKSLFYRFISFFVFVITTYLMFREFNKSLQLTIFNSTLAFIIYYLYELFWENYLRNKFFPTT